MNGGMFVDGAIDGPKMMDWNLNATFSSHIITNEFLTSKYFVNDV